MQHPQQGCGKLPSSISLYDYETITQHAAWRWFENLRNERLIHLSMKRFMDFIMYTLHCGCRGQSDDSAVAGTKDCYIKHRDEVCDSTNRISSNASIHYWML